MNNAVRYQVMPPLSSEEYQELYESIKVEGIHEPIHIDEEGVIIDGHHRSRIAKELGIPCPVITHDDLDESGKRSLAFTLNLKRRHLNREQRRALIAESLKSDPQLSNREHERRTGANRNLVGQVREEMESDGRLSQSDSRVSGDGRVRPASQPKREVTATPASEWPVNKPAPVAETPFSPASQLSDGDLAELNQPAPAPESKPEPPKPRRTPITDDANRIGWEIRKAFEKLEKLTEDDRYNTNKEKVTPLLRGHLQYAIEAATNVLDNFAQEG